MNTYNTIDENIRIPNLPINKWFNLIIRCNNTTLDAFINGNISLSIDLLSIPKQNYGNTSFLIMHYDIRPIIMNFNICSQIFFWKVAKMFDFFPYPKLLSIYGIWLTFTCCVMDLQNRPMMTWQIKRNLFFLIFTLCSFCLIFHVFFLQLFILLNILQVT